MCSPAAERMLPQEAVGSGTPRPRNERADSVRIAAATPKLAETITGARAFGRRWRKMMRPSRAPRARCARARRLRELRLADAQELGADVARLAGPRGQTQRDHERRHGRLEQR